MTDERQQSDSTQGSDDSFDALLKKAAHVSGPKVASLGVQLHPGSALLEGRLRIQRRIGEGGMGVVYAAFDEQRRGTVALKTLNRLDAANVYRLKNEFRSLADVSHPNLCHLHELFGDAGQWFFTMELIDGERFDQHLRPDGAFDEARLRAVLPQLIDGIDAIHQAGKLHRDLKPSNVLVTREGRVVILDFGLAMDSELGGVGHTVRETSVSGTPGYMAPEQAAGQPATTASDYYALGAMLFEALTGKLPFDGRVHEMLVDKQRNDAPPVTSVLSTTPRDLAELCDRLLARDPEQRSRPSAFDVGRHAGKVPTARTTPPTRNGSDALLGRDRELHVLRDAYGATLSGRSVMVFLSGESGVGKSALVDAFLDELRDGNEAVVLSGRCYERESVPYKAFDSVVDELSRYLRKLSREEAGDLMPREVFALARLFPVLDRVDAVAHAPKKDIPDPQELQQRAFAAFGELLGRIRDRRPLVVYIDDLQWADQDSIVFMAYLLAHREPIPALVIASHRSEGAADNPRLQQTLRNARKNDAISTRALAVERLSPQATQALVQRSLGAAPLEHVTAIAAESQGSPFFVGELVRQVRASGAGPTRLTLHQAVLRHVLDLGSDARALIDVLAVAGRPLPVQLALDAANTTHDTVDSLLSERLLRTAGAGHERTIECYHDKIRETVAGAVDGSALKQIHERIARTLSTHAHANPEHLALHWHGAGDVALAAAYYEQAGDVSGRALAFDYAARQYEQALALFEGDAISVRALRIKLAGALDAAGRGREAARAYRIAAEGAAPEQALELTREAARLLMTSGYVDEGRELVREVLGAIGLSLPRSRRAAIARALWSRTRLKLRGQAMHAAPTTGIEAETERHLSALWAVVQGSMGNDPFLMVDMLAQYSRRALDAGSCEHTVRALAAESYLLSFDGAGTESRTDPLITRALAMAAPLTQPGIIGWVKTVHGAVLCDQGRFSEGRAQLATTSAWLQERCTGVQFELSSARIYDQIAGAHLGRFAELAATNPLVFEDARRRDDMFSTTMLGAGWITLATLAVHGAAPTLARLAEVKGCHSPQRTYQWPDFFRLIGELNLALYQGTFRGAYEAAQRQWQAIEHAQLLRLHIARGPLHYAYGGCALSIVRSAPSINDGQRATVDASVRRLRATQVGHAAAMASVLEAGLALQDGRMEHAAERLRFALGRFDVSELRMYAAAAKRRLGQLIGGDEGRALVVAGDAAMASELVLDVEATTEMLVPGCHR